MFLQHQTLEVQNSMLKKFLESSLMRDCDFVIMHVKRPEEDLLLPLFSSMGSAESMCRKVGNYHVNQRWHALSRMR